MVLGCCDCVGPRWRADPLASNSGRRGLAAARIYRKFGGPVVGDAADIARTDEKGPKPLRLVLIGKHEGENRRGRVAGPDVQFQGMFLPGDDDIEANLLGLACVCRIADRELRHRLCQPSNYAESHKGATLFRGQLPVSKSRELGIITGLPKTKAIVRTVQDFEVAGVRLVFRGAPCTHVSFLGQPERRCG